MSKTIDFYYAMLSPYAYLGFPGFIEIVKKHGAQVNFRPMAMAQKVFPATGGTPVAKRAPERLAYRLVELERWRKHNNMAMNLQPAFFPTDDTLAAGMAIAAREAGVDIGTFSFSVLRAVWAEERDISDAATLLDIAAACNLNGQELAQAAQTDAIRTRYDEDTDEAIRRGVFGAPFFFYKDEPFWGQDRLDFLDRALAD